MFELSLEGWSKEAHARARRKPWKAWVTTRQYPWEEFLSLPHRPLPFQPPCEGSIAAVTNCYQFRA